MALLRSVDGVCGVGWMGGRSICAESERRGAARDCGCDGLRDCRVFLLEAGAGMSCDRRCSEEIGMSHEGIRIVSQDEARGGETPKLTGDAIRPAKVRVDKSGGTGVVIEWKDGHRSSWNFAWLRAACPCATCHEEREKEGRRRGLRRRNPRRCCRCMRRRRGPWRLRR